jgi:hypothetical protein
MELLHDLNFVMAGNTVIEEIKSQILVLEFKINAFSSYMGKINTLE